MGERRVIFTPKCFLDRIKRVLHLLPVWLLGLYGNQIVLHDQQQYYYLKNILYAAGALETVKCVCLCLCLFCTMKMSSREEY